MRGYLSVSRTAWAYWHRCYPPFTIDASEIREYMAPASHRHFPASRVRPAPSALLQLALIVLVLVSVLACLPVFHDLAGITGIDAMDEGASIPRFSSGATVMLAAGIIVLIAALILLTLERSRIAWIRGRHDDRPLLSLAWRSEGRRGSGSTHGLASEEGDDADRMPPVPGNNVAHALRFCDAFAWPRGSLFLGEIPGYGLMRARAPGP